MLSKDKKYKKKILSLWKLFFNKILSDGVIEGQKILYIDEFIDKEKIVIITLKKDTKEYVNDESR